MLRNWSDILRHKIRRIAAFQAVACDFYGSQITSVTSGGLDGQCWLFHGSDCFGWSGVSSVAMNFIVCCLCDTGASWL